MANRQCSRRSQVRKFFALVIVTLLSSSILAADSDANANQATRVLVAGATGQTGQHIVRLLLRQGYTVIAMSRDGNRAAALGAGVVPVVADVTDPATLIPAFEGVNAVISAIGARWPIGDNGFEAIDFKGNRALIDMAKRVGARRFILISAGSAGREGFLYSLSIAPYPWKAQSEAYLRDSGLDYTIIAAGGLNDEPGGLLGIAIEPRSRYVSGQVSRVDVAAVAVAALEADETIGKTATVVNNPELAVDEWLPALISLPPDDKGK